MTPFRDSLERMYATRQELDHRLHVMRNSKSGFDTNLLYSSLRVVEDSIDDFEQAEKAWLKENSDPETDDVELEL